MGLFRLSTLISLALVIFLSITGGKSYGQEWMSEMFEEDEHPGEKSLFDIQLKAQEHFKYAEREYFSRYFKIDDYPELQYKNLRQYISYKRWEEYWLNHVDSKGRPVPAIEEYKEFTDFKRLSSKGPDANWVNINRTAGYGGYWGMGRIREIAFHPTEPNTFWLGADQGGIWKTEDNGDTYTPVGDGLPFLRVSSICVDPDNPDILYMAGGGIGTNYWQRAIGVYKTTDGGQNWVATGFTSELADNKYIRRLVMSPADPSVLIVTTKNGTYRTADSGNNWTLVNGGEGWDIIFHADGNTVLIGKGSTIIRSTDGGITWATAVNSNESGIFKHLTLSPVNTDYLAAQSEGGGFTSIFVSTDKGETWEKKSTVTDDTGGTIGFSSSDENTLYRGWTKIFKSTNLGSNWEQKTNWYYTQFYPEVHADHFRIEKNPHKENTLYFCNDGGLYILEEANMRWTEKSEGLIISQYYSLSSSQSNPDVLLCGSQDNGGWYRRADGTWITTNGGDGMHTWQSPDNIHYGYSSYPGGKLYRTNNSWSSYSSLYDNITPEPSKGDWNSRFAIDPNNTNRIVTGCFRDVYESTDQGETWKKISYSLAGGNNLHAITIPDADSDIIYTSSGPNLYYTYNRGEDWSSSYVGNGNTIQEIAVSDYDPKLVWVVTSGYTDGSKVFRSRNGGRTWENISGSLPNISGLSIVHRKGTTESLYVGMTYGVYYRTQGMTDWEFYGHGIPNTEIRDLDIQYNQGKLRSATYGRGLYEADLHAITGTIPVADYSLDKSIVCAEESIQFTNASSDAISYVWNFGDGNKSYYENPSYAYSEPGTYTVRLTAFNENNTSTYTGSSTITVKPNLAPVKLGPESRDIGFGRYSGGENTGLIFNVNTPSKLLSFNVYSNANANRTFAIYDRNGDLINSLAINLRAGENRIEMNTELPAGTDFTLVADNTEGFFYNNVGAVYPYGVEEYVSITGNTEFDREGYYYFYDWEVQYLGCDANMLPVLENGDNIPVEQIIAYPNPVRDRLNLRVYGFDDGENIVVSIIDLDGKTVYIKEMFTSRVFDIDISSLGNSVGPHILEIKGQTNSATRRIIRILD